MLIKVLFSNYHDSHEYFGDTEKQKKFHQKVFREVSKQINGTNSIPTLLEVDDVKLVISKVNPCNEEGIRLIYYTFKGS